MSFDSYRLNLNLNILFPRNQLNYVIEEIKNPERNLPLSIFIGIPLVIVCYLLVIIGYLTVLTPQEFLTTDAVAVTLANRLYGVMAWSIPILVSCSTFGSANGSAFSGGRLAFAAAREGHLPRFLAMIHTKRRTPLPGLIFSSIISFVMIIPDSSSFEVLLSYMGFFNWFGYLLSISSIIWLRYKEPEVRRPFKVWFGIPIFMVVVSLYLVIAPFYETPLQSFYCVLFVLAAIPFYLAFVRYEVVPRCFLLFFNRVTYKLQTICDVALPVEEGDIEASSSLMSQLSE